MTDLARAADGLPADRVGFVPFERDEIEQSIPARFEQQVARHPDRLAVKTPEHTWSYAELNREANRLAHAVLARAGPGLTPVVLLGEQGAPLIAAILGVLKAGKILVMLDPSHPRARLAQLAEEVEPTAVVTTGMHREIAAGLAAGAGAVIDLDALPSTLSDVNPPAACAADDVALILYTSGSTGRPKGVMATHRNWVHNTWNYTNAFRLSPDDRISLVAFGTSQAVKNLCLGILTGASLFPFDVRRQGLQALATLLRDEGITFTVMGASLFRAFADVLDPGETFPAVRVIRLGSEPLETRDVELYRRHFPPTCLLVNGLAAGETQTIRFFRIDHETHMPGPLVPVGYPVEDKPVRLLDDAGREVGPGEVGEIVVDGPYFSPGYWRRPDLTEAAFRTPAEEAGPAAITPAISAGSIPTAGWCVSGERTRGSRSAATASISSRSRWRCARSTTCGTAWSSPTRTARATPISSATSLRGPFPGPRTRRCGRRCARSSPTS